VRSVKRALFADNAGSVNGIKASKTPRRGRLLALGSDGKFAASALPDGTRGPRGAQGPAGPVGTQGTTGPRGPSSARTAIGVDTQLGYVQGVETAVVALSNVDAGSYLVLFTGTPAARVAAIRGYLICRLRLNGAVLTEHRVIVGETAGATGALDTAIQWPVTRTAPFELSVTCLADTPSSGEGFRVYSPVLSAIKLDSVTAG
jgi:hypothetical protein